MPSVSIRHHGRVALQGVVADTFLSRAFGLMFSFTLPKGACLVLDSCSLRSNPLHMLFVFFPLDILWLDEQFRIVDKRLTVRPFVPFVPSSVPSRYIVEMTAGQGHHFALGDRLVVKFKKN